MFHLWAERPAFYLPTWFVRGVAIPVTDQVTNQPSSVGCRDFRAHTVMPGFLKFTLPLLFVNKQNPNSYGDGLGAKLTFTEVPGDDLEAENQPERLWRAQLWSCQETELTGCRQPHLALTDAG